MPKPRDRLISIADSVREPPRRIVIERTSLPVWFCLLVLTMLGTIGVLHIAARFEAPQQIAQALQGGKR